MIKVAKHPEDLLHFNLFKCRPNVLLFGQHYLQKRWLRAVSSLLHPLFLERTERRWFWIGFVKVTHLVQRDHGVGHGEDEVDVVLRHLLRDQSQRWVILWGQSRCWASYTLTSALPSNTRPACWGLRSCISQRFSPTIKSLQYGHTYHCCRHAVHVLGVEVALSIVWPHNPGQTTV